MITNKQERITSQREVVLNHLKGAICHPSAEEIYLSVKKKLPRISRGTVYRNLHKLKEKGEVQEILSGISHYDGNVMSHAHFICRQCNRIFDVFDICQGCEVLRKKRIKVGRINNFKIHLYGYCKKCQGKSDIVPRLQKRA